MIDALRQAAGADAVAPPYADRWRVHGASPQALVSPATPEDVAAVLALCSVQGWRVEPAGAGTWFDHGRATEQPAHIILSTHRLASRIEAEPADLVVGADAGVPLDTLQRRLAGDNQELPLDPPHAPDATIGATIALAAAGPLRASAGTPRDHVLGVTVATGDGRLLRFGGRVVKNVAGYDVVRLLTGSRGTLGIITGLWLRLRAMPAADHSLLVSGPRERLLQLIAGLGDVMPAAAELLAPATARTLVNALGLAPARPGTSAGATTGTTGSGAGAARSAAPDWALALRLRGGVEELMAVRTKLTGLVAGLGLTESPGTLWHTLGGMEAAAAPVLRVAGVPAALASTLALCTDFISRSDNDLEWHLAAHATAGIVRMWPAGRTGGRLPDMAEALIELREAAETAGGTMILEAAPPSLQARVPVRGAVDEVTRRLESELKRVLDPEGILAPGRWA